METQKIKDESSTHMRHNVYVLVTLSNPKFRRENPTLPTNKISPNLRATLFSQPIQISPKI
jgi:hypothetical protein